MAAGSIEDTASRLALWCRRSPRGMALVAFYSEQTRHAVALQLRRMLRKDEMPWYDYQLPRGHQEARLLDTLVERWSSEPPGVLSITGLELAEREPGSLAQTIQALNLRREAIASLPHRQIWWAAPAAAEALRVLAPDLLSWFLLRLEVTAEAQDVVPAEQRFFTPRSGAISPEEARRTAWELEERAIRAQNIGVAQDDVHRGLLLPALEVLLRAGLVEEATQLAEQFGLPPHFLEAQQDEPLEAAARLNRIGVDLLDHARFSDAEPLLRRTLTIREQALGPDHPDTATSLNNLAGLYERQGRLGEAEPLYRRALAIREQALGPDHPATAMSLNNLASLYESQGRLGEAEPLYRRALAIREQALGPDHPDTATSLNNLASLYESQGRLGEAEPLYRRALAICEQALGPDHPATATSLNNLASLYESQGRLGEAEPLYRRALAIREQALGPDHPDTATSLNNLAYLYQRQGRLGEAEPLLRRALAIYEQALGPDHSDTAKILNNLAYLYKRQGRQDEAAALLRRGIAVRE